VPTGGAGAGPDQPDWRANTGPSNAPTESWRRLRRYQLSLRRGTAMRRTDGRRNRRCVGLGGSMFVTFSGVGW